MSILLLSLHLLAKVEKMKTAKIEAQQDAQKYRDECEEEYQQQVSQVSFPF